MGFTDEALSRPIIAVVNSYTNATPGHANLNQLADQVMRGIEAAGGTAMIPTGLAMELPEGTVGLVYARSGLASKKGLAPANKVGVIDSDYRGEVMVALHNHSAQAAVVEPGERIAQLVVAPVLRAAFAEADALSDTVRGEGGFGSTGRK